MIFKSTCWKKLSRTVYLRDKQGEEHAAQYRTLTKLKNVRIKSPTWLETEEQNLSV